MPQEETSVEITNNGRIVEAFIILELIGGVGLVIVVLTAILGPGVKRYSTWYNFGASWIFSCISYTLLFLAGQLYKPQPDLGLCVLQGALVYAAPTLTACTTLALITHMLLNLRRAIARCTPLGTNSRAVVALLIIPYIVWLATFIGILVYEISNPETVRVSPDGTYCNSTDPEIRKIPSLVVVSCMVLTITIQGVIGLRLYRSRHVMSGSSQSVVSVIRVMLFGLLDAIALGVAVAYVMTNDQTYDMILAPLPVLVVLIFGSQLDLINVWMCRRKSNQALESLPGQHASLISSHDVEMP